eukprot:764634-Hanusia_phi.AAC.4
MKGLFSRGSLPERVRERLTGADLSSASTPSVHELPAAGLYGTYGVCIKDSGERWASTRVVGSACAQLKTNSFVTSSLLQQDGADVMEAYGELGKAWRFACDNIQRQTQLVTRKAPFACERSVTVGDSGRFGTVQVHRGTWSIPDGSAQGSLQVSRTCVSVDSRVLAETVNVSMRKSADAPITSVTLTATAIVPDSVEARKHAANPALQAALGTDESVVSRIILGLPHPVVAYGAFGDTGESHHTSAVDHGIKGLASVAQSCRLRCDTPCREMAGAALLKETKHIGATYELCGDDAIKASAFCGKDLDLVVVSTLTCLPGDDLPVDPAAAALEGLKDAPQRARGLGREPVALHEEVDALHRGGDVLLLELVERAALVEPGHVHLPRLQGERLSLLAPLQHAALAGGGLQRDLAGVDDLAEEGEGEALRRRPQLRDGGWMRVHLLHLAVYFGLGLHRVRSRSRRGPPAEIGLAPREVTSSPCTWTPFLQHIQGVGGWGVGTPLPGRA